MSQKHTTAVLTLGDFIVSVYDDCGKRGAGGIVWLCAQARLVVFQNLHAHQLTRKSKT